MTRNFEKYFPLPFKTHIFREKLIHKADTLTVYAANNSYIYSSRIENRFDVFEYMVTCANFMPEAELALHRARAALTRVCTHCECEDKACGDCIVRAANDCAKNCLTKLDAGYEREEDAKDVESHS